MQHKYKVGDRVWWDGLKGKILKIEKSYLGRDMYLTDIVFEPDEDNPTVLTFGFALKPIITLKAELS